MKKVSVSVDADIKKVSLYRERKLTKAERKTDPRGRVVAEWVHVTFGAGEPEVVVNRDICE
jgi:hypothetical protein